MIIYIVKKFWTNFSQFVQSSVLSLAAKTDTYDTVVKCTNSANQHHINIHIGSEKMPVLQLLGKRIALIQLFRRKPALIISPLSHPVFHIIVIATKIA